MSIMIEIEGSGKHCHVTQETLYALFGEGFELEVRSWLSQPGQFVTPHRITVHGPRRETELSIVGPCRVANQIELSLTDARSLGYDPPIRESGDVAGTPGARLVGPNGEVEISEGVIIMKRHVHIAPDDGVKFGITDKQIVKVKVTGERALIFDEVVARVGVGHATFMHLDYDEYNAAGVTADNIMGEILL